jgi:hypothetical protein
MFYPYSYLNIGQFHRTVCCFKNRLLTISELCCKSNEISYFFTRITEIKIEAAIPGW